MTRDETAALFLESHAKRKEALAEGKSQNEAQEAAKAHWNAWADRLLVERKAMETDGRWSLQPENPATKNWLHCAKADFAFSKFVGKGLIDGEVGTDTKTKQEQKAAEAARDARFNGFIFPGDASFRSASFSRNAEFVDAIFFGNARFDGVNFSGDATFHGYAWFTHTAFSGDAFFSDITFSGDAWFADAAFSRRTFFQETTFCGDAPFNNAIFSGYASFRKAVFCGNVHFESVNFKEFTAFHDANFLKAANFAGVKIERAFNMTGAAFSQVPEFSQADVKQAPDFDEVRFPLLSFLRGGDSRLIAQYRAIRRLSIQGADYEREQMAFKGELRARRWTADKWWHPSLWLGILYDGIADCGRSIIRPLVAWALVVALFSALYLANAGITASNWQNTCAGSPMQKWERAVSLSMSVGVPLIGNSRTEEVRLFYDCVSGKPATPTASSVSLSSVPLSANVLQVTESVLSAVLIFLILLAVKNRFKIK